MKEYKIRVKLTTMDMYRFLMRHEYGSFSGLLGLAVSILALLSLLLGVGEGDRNMQILLGVVALGFTVLNPTRLFLRAQKQIVTNPTFQKPIDYTFREAGLHIAQDEVEMDVAWNDMQKLVKGKKILVLYVSRVVGYIFPKSQCNGQFEELAAAIELKLVQAKNGQNTEGNAIKENDKEDATKDKVAEERIQEKMATASKIDAARALREASRKSRRNYEMPPGEAEIWGEDE